MTNIPIGVGPCEWVWELGQGASALDTHASSTYRCVTTTLAAMGGVSGVGPMWLKGVASILIDETSGGTGQLYVTTPPYVETPLKSEAQYVVGSGCFLESGGDQTNLTTWLSTNGIFFFRESGVSTGQDFGNGFTVAEGDRLVFCFDMPMTDAPPA